MTSLRVKLPLRWATLVLCFHQFQEKLCFPSWMQQFARTSLNLLHTLILVLTEQIPAKTKATNTNKFNNSPTRSAHGQCVCLQCHGARALPYIQARSVLCTIRLTKFMTVRCLNAFLCLHECLHCCGTESETDCRSLSCASMITLYQ